MAQVKITDLPVALALTGNESVPIVQNGVTVQTTTGNIASQPNLQYTFLTATQQAGLANSRYLAVGSGLQTVDGGAQGTVQINLTGAAQSLNSANNGIQVKTDANTLTARQITTGTGLGITNGDGVAGNPIVSLGTFLSNFQSMSGSTGLVGVKAGTISPLAIAGTSNNISVANGDGSTGNPTINLVNTAVTPGTYSSATFTVDSYGRITYAASNVAGGVTTFSGGTTGLTPSTASAGDIVLGGILNVANGGSGASTLTGYLVGNGTNAFTAVSQIPTTDLSGTVTNAQLTNSAITVNGTSISLGSSGTITAAVPYALTIGTGLSGTSYNGSSAVTIAIDSTVATLTGIQTLTNKSISGSSNTLSSIGNSSLTNSSVTFNGSTVALGSSATITASTTNALTIGTGLSGSSFNGGSAVTIANTGVLSFSGGTTGLTPATSTSGNITLGGTLVAANGGTGQNLYTTGDMLYASATTILSKLTLGTSGYVLTAGASAPAYVAQSTLSVGSATTATTATNVAGGAAGSLVYQTGAATTSTLALGTSGYVLTAGATAPTYVAQSTLSVGSATNATNVGVTSNTTDTADFPRSTL